MGCICSCVCVSCFIILDGNNNKRVELGYQDADLIFYNQGKDKEGYILGGKGGEEVMLRSVREFRVYICGGIEGVFVRRLLQDIKSVDSEIKDRSIHWFLITCFNLIPV